MMKQKNRLLICCVGLFMAFGLAVILGASIARASGEVYDISALADINFSKVDGQTVTTVTFDQEVLHENLKQRREINTLLIRVTYSYGAVKLQLTEDMIKVLADREISLELKTGLGSYIMPASEINPDELFRQIGTDAAGIKISLVIAGAAPDKADILQKAVRDKGLTQLGTPVEFKLEASGRDKTFEISGFDRYITRTVTLSGPVDINTAVAVTPDAGGGLQPVPTQFTEKDGKTIAIIKQKTNSVVTVTEHSKDFIDVSNDWARSDIKILAYKQVISGIDESIFAPENKITRAQFTALIVRALGLEPRVSGMPFRDVKKTDWYAGAVGAAVEAGIISGYSDGTFKPNDYVTREQVAVVLAKTLAVADIDAQLAAADRGLHLARFRDRAEISPWAEQFVAMAARYGIVSGDNNGNFAPGKVCTRAEAAVMIRKMMRQAGFITPVFQINHPADNFSTNKNTLEVTGQVEAGSSVTVNGRPAYIDSSGDFNLPVNLVTGKNDITVKIIDPLGHAATLTRKVTYDLSPSSLSVNAPADNLLTNKNPLTVTGTAETGSTVTVNDMRAAMDALGNFSKVVELNTGKNLISITARDAAGNLTTVTRTVVYDNVPPGITISAPDDNLVTGSGLVVVTGFTEPGSIFKVNGSTVALDSAGNFSKVVDLAVYSNNIDLSAVDPAGNLTAVTRKVVFNDNRVTGLVLPETIKIGAGVTIQYDLSLDGYVTVGIYKENGSLVRTLIKDVFKPAGPNAQVWNGQDGKGVLVPDGTYRFVVEARDARGNMIGRAEKTQAAAQVPSLNNVKGTPEIFNPLNSGMIRINYNITCEALVTATILKGNNPVKTLIANFNESSGSHSVSWDGTDDDGSPVPDGAYTYRVEAVSIHNSSLKSIVNGDIVVEKEPPRVSELNIYPVSFNIGSGNLNISFNLSESARVNIKVVDKKGQLVHTVINNTVKNAGFNRISWDGKVSNGKFIPQGDYTIVLNAVDNFGKISNEFKKTFTAKTQKKTPAPGGYHVPLYSFVEPDLPPDNAAPFEEGLTNLDEVFISPNPLKIGSAKLNIRYNLKVGARVKIEIFRGTDLIRTVLDSQTVKAGYRGTSWDGKNENQEYVPEGEYTVVIEAVGASGQSTKVDAKFTAGYFPVITNPNISPDPFNPKNSKAEISYHITGRPMVTVEILYNNFPVRTLRSKEPISLSDTVYWDGRNVQGEVVADGTYYLRITAESPTVEQFRSIVKQPFMVEKSTPTITEFTYSPNPFRLYRTRTLNMRYFLSESARVTVQILKGSTLVRSISADQARRAGYNTVSWDGKDGSGNYAVQGEYTVVISALDGAGKKAEVRGNISFYPRLAVEVTEPAKDSSDISVGSKIVVTFNDSVKKGSNFTGILLQVENRYIPYRVELTGDKLIITPFDKMAYNTVYTIIIPEGAVSDFTGKSPGSAYTFKFTTEATPRPGFIKANLSDAVTSTFTESGNRIVTRVTVNETTAVNILKQYKSAETAFIPVTAACDTASVELTGGLVKTLVDKNMSIEIQTIKASLLIPAEELNIEKLAQKLGVNAADVRINLSITAADHGQAASFETAAQKLKYNLLATPVVFKIQAVAGDRTVDIRSFDRYISFTINLSKAANANLLVGTAMDGGNFLPLPTQFRKENGMDAAVIKSKFTDTFTVIENNRVFADLKKHWAKGVVSTLASKLIISGVTAKEFAPEWNVTRAQFVGMMVRALGLKPQGAGVKFRDVSAGAWYAGAVAAAVDAGLIQGYSDGSFKPNAFIKREEAAVIIVRAMESAGVQNHVSGDEAQNYLIRFKDGTKISPWAKDFTATAVKHGILKGSNTGLFNPKKNMTRAETAVIVNNMLRSANLI